MLGHIVTLKSTSEWLSERTSSLLIICLIFAFFGGFVVLFCFIQESVSHYISLTWLELAIQTRLALNSQRSTCLCFLSTESKGMPGKVIYFAVHSNSVCQDSPLKTFFLGNSGYLLEVSLFAKSCVQPEIFFLSFYFFKGLFLFILFM